jgi:hypothetical protein
MSEEKLKDELNSPPLGAGGMNVQVNTVLMNTPFRGIEKRKMNDRCQ